MRKHSQEVFERVAKEVSDLPARSSMLVACSGGPDSVFLAYAMHELGFAIALAHVNYGLRGSASDADEALVKDYAQRWEIPCHVLAAPSVPASHSIQDFARQQRYAFFEQLMDQQGYTCCATAHHRDDQVETRLLSLLRSRKPPLWRGIPARRQRYLRPLLSLGKPEILAVLDHQQLPYRHDTSNEETYYLRNRVRHRVLPALREIHPQAEAHLLRRGDWYDLQYQWLRQQMTRYLPAEGKMHLDWRAFVQEQGEKFLPLLVAEVLDAWGLQGAERDDALRLIDSLPGAYRDLPQGRLQRDRHGLELLPRYGPMVQVEVARFEGKRQHRIGERKVELTLPAPAPERFGDPNVLYLDADRIQFPLMLRAWQKGDRMKPLGMQGHKKLSDIFIDAKYDPLARQQAIVLVDQQGIVGLSDYRVAERVKLRSGTKVVLRVKIDPAKSAESPPPS